MSTGESSMLSAERGLVMGTRFGRPTNVGGSEENRSNIADISLKIGGYESFKPEVKSLKRAR